MDTQILMLKDRRTNFDPELLDETNNTNLQICCFLSQYTNKEYEFRNILIV